VTYVENAASKIHIQEEVSEFLLIINKKQQFSL